MPVPGPPSGGTRSQQVSFYESYIQQAYPGNYQGNKQPFTGMSFALLYTTLANQNPKYSARQLAALVVDVAAAQQLGTGVQAAANELGKFSATAEKALKNTNFNTTGLPNSLLNVPSGLDAIGQFFNDLGNVNTWIRVAKVLIGGVLLIVGLAKLTGFDKGVVGKAVKVAPLL